MKYHGSETDRDRVLPRLLRAAQTVEADGDLRVTPVVVVIAAVVLSIPSCPGQPHPLTPQVLRCSRQPTTNTTH